MKNDASNPGEHSVVMPTLEGLEESRAKRGYRKYQFSHGGYCYREGGLMTNCISPTATGTLGLLVNGTVLPKGLPRTRALCHEPD